VALSAAWIACAVLATFLPPVPVPPSEAGASQRSAFAGPLKWEQLSVQGFEVDSGLSWQVVQERASTGKAGSGKRARLVQQTRLRIEQAGGGETLGILQHLDNTTIVALSPNEPRAGQAQPARPDPGDPWPNPCGLEAVPTEHPLDLDHDGRRELAVRFFATVGRPGASGYLLVAANPDGTPRIVQIEDLVPSVNFQGAVIRAIDFSAHSPDPTVLVDYVPLHGCRFLELFGVSPASDCLDCCRFPVLLRPAERGMLAPVYEPKLQRPFLEQQQELLTLARATRPGARPAPGQEAAICRAAAFYYLTGLGSETRETLEGDLGSHADGYRVRLLLDKLDRYFLFGITPP